RRRERGHDLERLRRAAAGLDEDAALAQLGDDAPGGGRVGEGDAAEHAAPAPGEAELTGDALHERAQPPLVRFLRLLKGGIRKQLDRVRRRLHAEAVAAEGAAVFARFEEIELLSHEHEREREAEAGDALREADDVGPRVAERREAEVFAGAADAGLDL